MARGSLAMSTSIVRRAAGFMKMGRPKPLWFETVAQKYPPLTFTAPKAIRPTAGPRPKSGPAPIWRPPKLEYPEDRYVRKIYQVMPEERLRPTSLAEDVEDSNEAQNIIRRQLELMEAGTGPDEAFQLASSQFQEERKQREILRKVAIERARYSKEQVMACQGEKIPSKRHEPVGETIRRFLEEEKVVLAEARRAVKPQLPNWSQHD